MCDEEDDAEDDGEDEAVVNYQENEDDDDEPPEMVEELDDMDDEAINIYEDQVAAAEAFITKAKKLRSGAEKLRGFYKEGVSPTERKNGTKSFKDKAPCAKCGQRGHWHSDKDNSGKLICPQADKPWPKRRNKPGPGKRRPGRKKKKKKSREGVGRLRKKPKKVRRRKARG